MKMLNSLLLFMLCLIVTTSDTYAQTEVEGSVEGQWDLEGSPYIAIETIYVSRRNQLEIAAGVDVIFDDESAFFVYGTLNAQGTEEDSIYFGPADDGGNWLGLRFVNAHEQSRLNYTILTNGRRLFDEEHSDTLNHGGNLFGWQSDISISNTRISNGISRGFGGGFSIHGGQVTFVECFFNNNVTSTLGGAGNLDRESDAGFDRCRFFQNRSEWGGGGFNIFEGSEVEIRESKFTENEGAAGGGISLYGGNLLAENCTFTHNNASMGGAAYLRHEQNRAELFHCDFIRNRAEGEGAGGALMLRDGVEAEVAHCRFIENYAQWGGGAIYFAGRANSDLHHNLYLRNFSERVGGAIALNPNMGNQPLIITHSTFLDNRSGGGEHPSHIANLPNGSSLYISSSVLWGPNPYFSNDNNVEIVYSQTSRNFQGEGNSTENPELFALDSTWALISGNSPCFDSGDPNLPDDPDGSRNDRGWQFLPRDAAEGLDLREISVQLREGERVRETVSYSNTTEAPVYVSIMDLWQGANPEVLINLTELVEDNDIQAALKIDDGYLIAGGNNGNDPNKIYRLDEELNLTNTFNQPGGVEGDGFLDMAAFDDQVIFAGDEEQIVEFTIDGELGEQYEGPDAVNRFQAVGVDVQYADNELNLYLGGDEGFVVKTDNDFWEVDRTEVGDTINALAMKGNARAYYVVTEPSRGQHILSLVTPDNAKVVPLYELTPASPEAIMGGFDIKMGYEDGRGKMTGVWKEADGEDDWLFVTELFTTWLCVFSEWHLLMPGDSAQWDVLFAGDHAVEGDYNSEISLSVNGFGVGNEITTALSVQPLSIKSNTVINAPDKFSLLSISPNPFNSQTNIHYYIPKTGFVTIRMFEQNGREIETIYTGIFPAGNHHVNLSADRINSGVYFIRMELQGYSPMYKSLILIK